MAYCLFFSIPKEYRFIKPYFAFIELSFRHSRIFCWRLPIQFQASIFAGKPDAFVKTGGLEEPSVPRREEKKISRDVRALSEAFLRDVFVQPPDLTLWAEGEKLFLLPDGLPDGKKRGIIRAGVPIGTIVKGRIEPAHGLFTAFPAADFRRCADFHQDDPLLSRFFHGEEIPWDGEAGYTAVAVEGMTVGFGKSGNGTLKNKYPKGLRW